MADADTNHSRTLNLQGIKSLLTKTYDKWSRDEASRMAASLAFYTMLSLAPLLVIAVAIAGAILGPEAAAGQLYQQIQDLVGDTGARAIQDMMKGANKPAAGVLASVLGFATLLFGASNVIGELRTSMNHIWEIPVKDQSILEMIRDRFRLMGLVVGAGFLLLVSLVVSAVLATLGSFLQSWLPLPEVVTQMINFGISFVVVTILFAALFKVLPETNVEWRDVLLGAMVTALLFTIGKTLIGIYLGKASFGSTYGAAGSLVIVLVWVYYSAQIYFFGTEFTRVYAMERGSLQPKPYATQKPSSAPVASSGTAKSAATGNAALHPSVTDQAANATGSVLGVALALAKVFRRQSH